MDKSKESHFNKLGLSHDLVKALADNDIIEPTRVQEQVIPMILEGKDLLCQSETGSGKTISFAVPIIEKLKPEGGAQVLVVAPTRELAKQIADEFTKFANHKRLNIVTIYGGVAMGPQVESIPSADVVVGTPGRILDLNRQGYLKLDLVKHLVLDECDRMFDMGFIEDVESIIYATPKDRQVLLFSATVSSTIKDITGKYMNEPEHVRVTPHLVKGKLDQQYYVCPHNQKISLLAHILKEHTGRAIVFCRTKRLVDMVARALQQNGYRSDALHGDMSQAKRERVVDNFIKGKTKIVIATDVASRGLHVDDVELVVNYNLPEETETYVHRVGRTARQGKEGTAITLLDDQDFRLFDDVMRHYEGEIEKLEATGVKKILFKKDAPPKGRGGPQGRSGSRQFNKGPHKPRHKSSPRTESFDVKGGGPKYEPKQERDPYDGHSLADLD